MIVILVFGLTAQGMLVHQLPFDGITVINGRDDIENNVITPQTARQENQKQDSLWLRDKTEVYELEQEPSSGLITNQSAGLEVTKVIPSVRSAYVEGVIAYPPVGTWTANFQFANAAGQILGQTDPSPAFSGPDRQFKATAQTGEVLQPQTNYLVRLRIALVGGGAEYFSNPYAFTTQQETQSSPPQVTTLSMRDADIRTDGGTMRGLVNPLGKDAAFVVLTGPSQNQLTPTQTAGYVGTDNTPHEVSANISGLSQGTTVFYQFAAGRVSGGQLVEPVAYGAVLSFVTKRTAPTGTAPYVLTLSSMVKGPGSVQFTGTVLPDQNDPSTVAWFEYGLNGSLTQRTSSIDVQPSTGPVVVVGAAQNLPEGMYSFQLVSQNRFGTGRGGILTVFVPGNAGGSNGVLTGTAFFYLSTGTLKISAVSTDAAFGPNLLVEVHVFGKNMGNMRSRYNKVSGQFRDMFLKLKSGALPARPDSVTLTAPGFADKVLTVVVKK